MLYHALLYAVHKTTVLPEISCKLFYIYGNYLQYQTLNLLQIYEQLTSENTTKPEIALVWLSEENRVTIH